MKTGGLLVAYREIHWLLLIPSNPKRAKTKNVMIEHPKRSRQLALEGQRTFTPSLIFGSLYAYSLACALR